MINVNKARNPILETIGEGVSVLAKWSRVANKFLTSLKSILLRMGGWPKSGSALIYILR